MHVNLFLRYTLENIAHIEKESQVAVPKNLHSCVSHILHACLLAVFGCVTSSLLTKKCKFQVFQVHFMCKRNLHKSILTPEGSMPNCTYRVCQNNLQMTKNDQKIALFMASIKNDLQLSKNGKKYG